MATSGRWPPSMSGSIVCKWNFWGGAIRCPGLGVRIEGDEFGEATEDGLPAIIVRTLAAHPDQNPFTMLDYLTTAYDVFRHRFNAFNHRPDWRAEMQRRLMGRRESGTGVTLPRLSV